jgi:hypothetical protein
MIAWMRANPPRDYVTVRNRLRAWRFSRARRALDEAALIEWAMHLRETVIR